MTTIGFTALRLMVAGVFGVAGVAKLRDPSATRVAVGAAGVPRWARAGVARVLPLLELAVAAALLASSGRPAAFAAVALITVLNIGVGIAVLRGTTDTCGCFGRTGARFGAMTVVRNGTLALASIAVYLAA